MLSRSRRYRSDDSAAFSRWNVIKFEENALLNVFPSGFGVTSPHHGSVSVQSMHSLVNGVTSRVILYEYSRLTKKHRDEAPHWHHFWGYAVRIKICFAGLGNNRTRRHSFYDFPCLFNGVADTSHQAMRRCVKMLHDVILFGLSPVHHTRLEYKAEATPGGAESKLSHHHPVEQIIVTINDSNRNHFSCHGEKNSYYT